MTENEKKISFRLLILITTHRLADKAVELFEEFSIPLQYRFNAEGTASSEIMDMLGLGSTDKSVITSILPESTANEILKNLFLKLKMNTVNSGIAFTIPLNSASGLILKINEDTSKNTEANKRKENENMSENKYSLIAAVVNQGFSGDVMNAVHEAGAGGGTVIRSHSIGNDKIANFWGLDVQEEKETVLILSKAENKLAIMKCIGEKCGMHSEAKGIVLSIPVDSATGID